MAAEVVQCAATGVVDVPEMRTVRTAVGFTRTHPQHPAHAAPLHRLFRLHHGGREDFRLGVTMNRAGGPGRLHHLPGLFRIAPQRLGTDLVALRRGERQRNRQMLIVGQCDDEQINVVAHHDLLVIGVFLNAPPLGKQPRAVE